MVTSFYYYDFSPGIPFGIENGIFQEVDADLVVSSSSLKIRQMQVAGGLRGDAGHHGDITGTSRGHHGDITGSGMTADTELFFTYSPTNPASVHKMLRNPYMCAHKIC